MSYLVYTDKVLHSIERKIYFMKIPIFEEINFDNFELETIREKITESRIGKVPAYINLSPLKKDERNTLVLELRAIFLELNCSPKFPFPCYLIGDGITDDFFPKAKTVKDLPDHFFKKVKRPNNREIQLLNKLSLKVDKINNLDMNKIFEDLIDTANSQKRLFNETKELYFLEILFFKLFEKEKLKNGKKI